MFLESIDSRQLSNLSLNSFAT